MNFLSQIFFNNFNHGYRAAILKKNFWWLPLFYIVLVTYLYYEKVRRTMRTAILSNLLKQSKSQSVIEAYDLLWTLHGCFHYRKQTKATESNLINLNIAFLLITDLISSEETCVY